MIREVAESLFQHQLKDKGRLLFYTRDTNGKYTALIDWKLEDIMKDFSGGCLSPSRTIPFLFK